MLLLDPLPPPFQRGLDDDQRAWLKSQFPALKPARKGCVTCRGKGTFRWYGPGGEIAEFECRSGDPWESCEEQWAIHRRLLYCGIGKAYQQLSWTDYIDLPDDLLVYAMDYLGTLDSNVIGGRGMVLWGPKGTGKTLYAALIAKEIAARGTGVYFDTLQGLIDRYTAGWTDRAAKDIFSQRITNIEVLVVDDLGREYSGGRGVNTRALEQVLRHRAQHQLATIITTNFDPLEVTQGYGDHIVSVLSGNADVLEFRGVDQRAAVREREDRERTLRLTRPLVIR